MKKDYYTRKPRVAQGYEHPNEDGYETSYEYIDNLRIGIGYASVNPLDAHQRVIIDRELG